MKTIYIILAAILFFNIGCNSQKQERKKAIEDANIKIEEQVGVFVPSALQAAPGNIHYAADVKFDNTGFTVEPNSFSKRPGKFIAAPFGQFPFKIEFLDSNGKTLDKYSMEDPRILRSCDDGEEPAIIHLDKGSFTLLIPENKEIGTVMFFTSEKDRKRIEMNFGPILDSLDIIK